MPCWIGFHSTLPTRAGDRNRNIGEHEERECEQVFDLLRRGGADVIPLGEGGQRAEHEHEQRVVEQAEEDRGERRVSMTPVDMSPALPKMRMIVLKMMVITESNMPGAMVMSMS